MSPTVAEVIVETLQAAGVKHCCGVQGDTRKLRHRRIGAASATERRSAPRYIQQGDAAASGAHDSY